jgi:hypothetical protein
MFDKYGRLCRQIQSKPQMRRAIKTHLGVKQIERKDTSKLFYHIVQYIPCKNCTKPCIVSISNYIS